jgi:Protein of unknown function (DUF4065)
MLRQRQGLDLHTVLKACYFADKRHLNDFGRPVFGATYRAMRFGPVPLEIYEMLKGEAIWLSEIHADRYPWRLDGYHLQLTENLDPDLSFLSDSDVEAVQYGFDQSCGMDFTERTAATHSSDWQAAELGIMRYEDMIQDGPEKNNLIGYLEENARFMRL